MMRRLAVLQAKPAAFTRAIAGVTTALLVAALSVAGLALGAPAAQAAVPSGIDLSADTSLTLTKLEQPQDMGAAANGLPITDLSAYGPIDGVQFSVTKVPLDTPINTATGWKQAATMSVSDAITRIGSAAPNATGTTDGFGVAAFDTLGVGLFLVEETFAPAGVVAGAPFLVALPIPHPTAVDDWLYDVHVYPKNARVAVSLDVVDRDAFTIDGAAGPANTVTWNALADIPRQGATDGYQVVSVIDSSLRFLATPPGATPDSHPGGVSVSLSGTSGFILTPADYSLTTPTGAGGEIVVTLLRSGLTKLDMAKAADATSQVRLSYITQVLAEGELANEVRLCASLECITGNENGEASGTGVISDTATTKWGPLKVLVHEVGKPENLIPGAKFKLYLSEADAKSGTNAISAGGATEWASDAQGRITVPGLRFSNFVDGVAREVSDPLYRNYWAVLVHVPAGWQGSSTPIPMSVVTASIADAQLAVVELYRAGGGSGDLPLTGAQTIAGMTIAALALLLGGVGTLFLVGKKRREAGDGRPVQVDSGHDRASTSALRAE